MVSSRHVIRRGGAFNSMAKIIQFPVQASVIDEDPEVDLLTAVDAAIRDLRDIADRWGEEAARMQADQCRRMLEKAYSAAT